MKSFKLLIVLLTVVVTSACSSSSDSKPVSPAPGSERVGQRTADNPFDQDAMGSWITTTCLAGNNGSSFQRMVSFLAHGKISITDFNYTSGNCSSVSAATEPTQYDYTVDNYANGGGQITINGSPQDIIIKGNQLTWNSNGSVVFTRTNQN